jgi:hypothetical protein
VVVLTCLDHGVHCRSSGAGHCFGEQPRKRRRPRNSLETPPFPRRIADRRGVFLRSPRRFFERWLLGNRRLFGRALLGGRLSDWPPVHKYDHTHDECQVSWLNLKKQERHNSKRAGLRMNVAIRTLVKVESQISDVDLDVQIYVCTICRKSFVVSAY